MARTCHLPVCILGRLFVQQLAQLFFSQMHEVVELACFSVHEQEKQIRQHAAQKHLDPKCLKPGSREQRADIPCRCTGRSRQQHIERIAHKIFADRSTEAMPEQDVRLDPCAGR